MSCTKALFPTSYFPSIIQMAAMVQEEDFLIETQETFPKQTNRNRTIILTANGPMTLSVPVVRPNGTHTITADIGISYAERWNVIHWRSIEAAYNSSPYFMYYKDDIETLLMKRYERLVDLNETLINCLAQKIKLTLKNGRTSQYLPATEIEKDYRYRFSYKHPNPEIIIPKYTQVFADRMPFDGNVGILDLLFNLGPDSKDYLLKLRF